MNPRADQCRIVECRVPRPGEYFLAEADEHLAGNTSNRGPGWVYKAVAGSQSVLLRERRYIVEPIEPPAQTVIKFSVEIDTTPAEEQLEELLAAMKRRKK